MLPQIIFVYVLKWFRCLWKEQREKVNLKNIREFSSNIKKQATVEPLLVNCLKLQLSLAFVNEDEIQCEVKVRRAVLNVV